MTFGDKMTEKELKALIVESEAYNSQKPLILSQIEAFKENINKYLPSGIKVAEACLASWYALGIFKNPSEIYLALDLDLEVKENYKQDAIFKSVEVALMLLNATRIERTNHTIKCSIEDANYYLELASVENSPCSDIKAFLKKLELVAKDYSLIKNVLVIVKHLIDEEDIKFINPYLITNILVNNLKKEALNNKYYKYLDLLIKGLDELTNTKRYIYTDLLNDESREANLSEVKLAEYRRLRKAISRINSVEEETIKQNSQTEITLDVNPVKINEHYEWHYELVGYKLESSGGVYNLTEVDYQTALLKGLFKGLKTVVDNNLTMKRIIIKADYEGILTDKMLSNDENKSRMKTIKRLIEDQKLKIKA